MAARQLLSPGAMLKVFSYNTWSSSPTHSPFQTHSLLRTLGHVSRDGAGVIALQEVTPELGALVRAEDWVKRDWLITSDKDYLNAAGEPPKGGHGTGSYRGGVKPKPGGKEAVMLMVKRSLVGQGSGVSIARLPVPRDDRGRALLTFDLHQNNKLIVRPSNHSPPLISSPNSPRTHSQLRLCTSHFTALPLNAPFRKRQYDQTIQALLAHPRAPVHLILADTNASVEHELTPFHPFTDAFLVSPACPPPPPGFSTGRASAQDVRLYQERLFAAGPTFGHLYPWVPGAPRKKPRKPRRIDRVWVNGAAEVVAYGERGGQEPVRESEGGGRMRDGEGRDGWMWESDHVGVEVTLRITGRAAP